jgi:transcriptional regulator
MYTPKHFAENDPERLAAFIDQHGFGALVTIAEGKPFASHIPFLCDARSNLLRGHVARANPQWRHFSDTGEVLVMFEGAHAYISPSWYLTPGVPTWNYAVTHVYGIARALEDPESIARIVEALTRKHESGNNPPWAPSYDRKMLNAIVGIEISVTSFEGKLKLSQNRSAADRASVIAKLEASGDPGDAALAREMRKNEPAG